MSDSIQSYIEAAKKAQEERKFFYNAVNYVNCKSKVKRSLENARKRANELGLFYYKCPICKAYHLTKQQTYESTMEEE